MSRVATDCTLPVIQNARGKNYNFQISARFSQLAKRVCPGSVSAVGSFRPLRHGFLCSIVLASLDTFQLYAYLLHRACLWICLILLD